MTLELTDLLEEARQRGFLGPGPVEPHLDHARAFAVAAGAPPARAADLGAGGGLPGLVLAAEFWPDAKWVFVDAQQKRTEFLREAVEDLGLDDRVHVLTERAELVGQDLDHRGTYDLVVSRSFGPPAVTIECAAPLLRVGGAFVVSEPPLAGGRDRPGGMRPGDARARRSRSGVPLRPDRAAGAQPQPPSAPRGHPRQAPPLLAPQAWPLRPQGVRRAGQRDPVGRTRAGVPRGTSRILRSRRRGPRHAAVGVWCLTDLQSGPAGRQGPTGARGGRSRAGGHLPCGTAWTARWGRDRVDPSESPDP